MGGALLVLGARLLVEAATKIARTVGLSDRVIGLTGVPIGISLPEIATAVIGALRGERELAVGNVVGSNIVNIGAAMGVTAVLAPAGVPVDPAATRFDLPVMIAVAFALLPLTFTSPRVDRREGALLLAYYTAYVALLLLPRPSTTGSRASAPVMIGSVVPLTVLALALLSTRELRRRRRAEAAADAWLG